MRVCFIGVGSIAKRHIKNLKRICEKNGKELIIDAVRHLGCSDEEKAELGLTGIFKSEEELSYFYDAIFITNPTDFHIKSLKRLHDKTNHFFIEKPLISLAHIDEARDFAPRKDALYYVACPLRYHAVIDYVRHNIDLSRVLSVRCISSSYLPDWRPGIDYRDTYSAHKALGGGVDIDLIHEWDYITALFGKPKAVKSMIGKKSQLEIDSPDFAIYIAEYDAMIAELHLDYFGRQTIRKMELYTEDDTIVCDLVNQKISWSKEEKDISFDENRDDFQIRELEHFIGLMDTHDSDNDIEHAISVLKLTQGDL